MSPTTYNRKVGLALCCPITSRVKGYPFEVPLPAGAPVEGVVLSDQIRCIDWKARRLKPIGRAAPGVLDGIRARLLALIGS